MLYSLMRRREAYMSIEDRVTALEHGLRSVQSDFLVHLSENNRHMAALNKVITQ